MVKISQCLTLSCPQVISLYACFNDNTLGKLWTSSMPYLFPFIVEYRSVDITIFINASTIQFNAMRCNHLPPKNKYLINSEREHVTKCVDK